MLSRAAAAEPGAAIRARLTGFTGFLRANGFGVGGSDALSVLETGERVGVFDRDVLRWSLRALLCARCDEWRRFDRLFDAYFLPPNRRMSWRLWRAKGAGIGARLRRSKPAPIR